MRARRVRPAKDLINRVRPGVPACPDPRIEDAIAEAMRRFCRDTHAWESTVSTAAVDGRTAYTLGEDWFVFEEDARVLAVRGVRAENGDGPAWAWDGRTLTLGSALKEGNGPLLIDVDLEPVPEAEVFPDWLFEDYADAIIGHALFRLLAVPAAEWANPELAPMYGQDYTRGVAEARMRKARSHTTETGRVQMRPFI